MGYPHNYQISSRAQALQPQAAAGARQSWEVQMSIYPQRREFIAGLASAAAARPLAARAQQGDRVRRIGVLMQDENDPLAKPYVSAFIQALSGLGWTEGRNVQMDVRWLCRLGDWKTQGLDELLLKPATGPRRDMAGGVLNAGHLTVSQCTRRHEGPQCDG